MGIPESRARWPLAVLAVWLLGVVVWWGLVDGGRAIPGDPGEVTPAEAVAAEKALAKSGESAESVRAKSANPAGETQVVDAAASDPRRVVAASEKLITIAVVDPAGELVAGVPILIGYDTHDVLSGRPPDVFDHGQRDLRVRRADAQSIRSG